MIHCVSLLLTGVIVSKVVGSWSVPANSKTWWRDLPSLWRGRWSIPCVCQCLGAWFYLHVLWKNTLGRVLLFLFATLLNNFNCTRFPCKTVSNNQHNLFLFMQKSQYCCYISEDVSQITICLPNKKLYKQFSMSLPSAIVEVEKKVPVAIIISWKSNHKKISLLKIKQRLTDNKTWNKTNKTYGKTTFQPFKTAQ